MIRARKAATRATSTLFRQTSRSLHASAASRMPCRHYTPAEEAELEAQERRELEGRFKSIEADLCDAMGLFSKVESGEALSAEQRARLDALKADHRAHRLAEHTALLTHLRDKKSKLETKIDDLTSEAASKADEILRLKAQLEKVSAELKRTEAVDTDSLEFITKEEADCSEEAEVAAGSGCRV